MNQGTRSELYLAMSAMILEKHPGEEGAKRLIQFVEAPTNKYIAEFNEFAGTQLNHAAYEGMLLSVGVGKNIIDALNQIRIQEPSMFYSIMGGIMLSFVAAAYMRNTIVTFTLATALITVGAKAAGVKIIGDVGK